MKQASLRIVRVGRVVFGNEKPLALIAGPCVIEDSAFTVRMGKSLASLAAQRKLPYVFKASYDKANRSSIKSFRGPGLRIGLEILRRVKEAVGCPVLTDVHSIQEAHSAADAGIDILQVPAFLSRQTDLLLACGQTGKVVNIKKGQFLAPWDMEHAIKKIESTGNRQILVTERGASFGYNNLIVDMRSLAILKQFGYPVIYDATHSVQLPGALNGASGGQREFVVPLARAAVGLGIAGIFSEVHPEPDRARSDGPNSLALRSMPDFIKVMQSLDKVAKQ
jgi:2-dehydro-3-deoxyphosphooctonate aldolase (KDO 8-P synthase)